jgi:hypothetical protein
MLGQLNFFNKQQDFHDLSNKSLDLGSIQKISEKAESLEITMIMD